MARFVSTNLNKRADLISGGVGPLSNALSERSPTPNPDESLEFSNAQFVINVPQYNVSLKYSGDSIFWRMATWASLCIEAGRSMNAPVKYVCCIMGHYSAVDVEYIFIVFEMGQSALG